MSGDAELIEFWNTGIEYQAKGLSNGDFRFAKLADFILQFRFRNSQNIAIQRKSYFGLRVFIRNLSNSEDTFVT